jgi:hypothetical protein
LGLHQWGAISAHYPRGGAQTSEFFNGLLEIKNAATVPLNAADRLAASDTINSRYFLAQFRF